MEQTQVYYINKINEFLALKQSENPQYSMRAFSRDMGIHSSTICQVIKGKRRLPLKHAHRFAKKMSLAPNEKTLFMESLYRTKTNIDDIKISKLDERFIIDESHHKVIAEWEHFAILELFEFDDFKLTSKEVAFQLGIDISRAEIVINNLLTASLLTINTDGEFQRTHNDIRTTEDISNQALKDSHKETLEMGINKIEEIEVELREFSSTTVAIDLEKLPEAKTIIREFNQKMTELLRDGKKTDVYQLAIQFFPLTENVKKNYKGQL